MSVDDGTDFLRVPLTAVLFGKRKLNIGPLQALIKNDILFLQDIGVTTAVGLNKGIRPSVETFFKRKAVTTRPPKIAESRLAAPSLSDNHLQVVA